MTPEKLAAIELSDNLMSIARAVQSRRPVSQARWAEVLIPSPVAELLAPCQGFAAKHPDAVHAILIACKDIVRAEAGITSF